METVERHVSVLFSESEPDRVKIIDWVMRQKSMVLTRFMLGKGPLLPAGEATIRLKECRPFLPEYWWDLLMGDQMDVYGAPFVPEDSAKHSLGPVCTVGRRPGGSHCPAGTRSAVVLHCVLGGCTHSLSSCDTAPHRFQQVCSSASSRRPLLSRLPGLSTGSSLVLTGGPVEARLLLTGHHEKNRQQIYSDCCPTPSQPHRC